MRIKPNCVQCQRPYLGGRDGLCEICARAQPPRKKIKRLRCLCGKVAVVVVIATVLTPQEEPIDVEVPLCRDCQKLELELEIATARQPSLHMSNPIQIVVVKSLPRRKRPLSGRKF